MGIGSKLTELMQANGTNANELAKRIGVSAQTIYSLIKRDNKKADIEILMKIADTFGVTAEYFVNKPHTIVAHFDGTENIEEEFFRKNLKAARLKKGVSQKDVAENIGVANSTYSLYESGNREPNVITIKKIAAYLNVSANSLLGLEEPLSTMAAHFDGNEYTEEELDKIKEFAAFVKSNRK